MNYNFVKGLLKINNIKFNKNKSLFYIQRRYIHINEIKTLIKKHGLTIVTSATAGNIFTGYLQHTSVQVQKENLKIQKKQFEYQKIKDLKERELRDKELNQRIKEEREKFLLNYDKQIKSLNKNIHEIEINI